jgi:hypothetical protein
LKNGAPLARFNLLTHNYLVRGAWCVVAAAGISCGGAAKSSSERTPAPAPTIPLPTAGLAGQRVGLFPLTLVAVEDSLRWNALVRDRRVTLMRADSVIGELLAGRAPEVNWITPDDLRRSARRAVGIATDPDQIGSAVLRAEDLTLVPDPLRSQLRSLTALAGARFAVVPAALIYKRRLFTPAAPLLVATAELSIVMVDVRLGRVVWRTVARGEGADAWTALTAAVKSLTPGLP